MCSVSRKRNFTQAQPDSATQRQTDIFTTCLPQPAPQTRLPAQPYTAGRSYRSARSSHRARNDTAWALFALYRSRDRKFYRWRTAEHTDAACKHRSRNASCASRWCLSTGLERKSREMANKQKECTINVSNLTLVVGVGRQRLRMHIFFVVIHCFGNVTVKHTKPAIRPGMVVNRAKIGSV